jgi:hypothetical protein
LPVTREVTEITYACPNEACGHIWIAQLFQLRVLYPSMLSPEPAAPPAPAAGGH